MPESQKKRDTFVKTTAQDWPRCEFIKKTEESMYDYLVLRDYDGFYLDWNKIDWVAQATIERLIDRGLVELKHRETRKNGRITIVKVTTRQGRIACV
jgi:hypothetical protein